MLQYFITTAFLSRKRMQNYCFTTYLPNVTPNFFQSFCKLFANSLICRCVIQQGFSAALQGRFMLHLNIIAREYTHIHITCLTNPSPYSSFDEMDGKSFILQATVKGVKGWNANVHVYREWEHIIRPTCSPVLKSTVSSPWRTGKRVKGDSSTRQGAFMNSSRSFHQNIKGFFKKFFIFLKKLRQVFYIFFLKNKLLFLVYIINLTIFANKKARRNASKTQLLAF